MRTLLRFVCAAATSCAAVIQPAGAVDHGRPQDPAQIPIMLRFTDQPTAKVLEALFSAAGVRGEIDRCVGGRITIALQNVTLGAALDAVARVADLDVQRGSGGTAFGVACRDAEGRRIRTAGRRPAGESVALRLLMERVDADGNTEPLAEPRVVTSAGAVEEVDGPDLALDPSLNDDGEIVSRTKKPAWKLRVVVIPGTSAGAREIRGVFEVSAAVQREREEGTVTITQPFRAVLDGERDAKLTSVELPGETWVLRLRDAE